jgi:hypothetical protein
MTMKLPAFCFAIAILGLLPLLDAQKSKEPVPAPVPVQIAAARKVFISNAGGESFETVIDQTVFNGGPDRPYNQFYAANRDKNFDQAMTTVVNRMKILMLSTAATAAAVQK